MAKEDPDKATTALQADDKMNRILWKQLEDHITNFMNTVTLADLCVESQSNACPTCTCPDYTQELSEQFRTGRRKPCMFEP